MDADRLPSREEGALPGFQHRDDLCYRGTARSQSSGDGSLYR